MRSPRSPGGPEMLEKSRAGRLPCDFSSAVKCSMACIRRRADRSADWSIRHGIQFWCETFLAARQKERFGVASFIIAQDQELCHFERSNPRREYAPVRYLECGSARKQHAKFIGIGGAAQRVGAGNEVDLMRLENAGGAVGALARNVLMGLKGKWLSRRTWCRW